MRTWICETSCICRKTLLVHADSRADALKRLKAGEGEGIDYRYDGRIRAHKVICEDGTWVKRMMQIRNPAS